MSSSRLHNAHNGSNSRQQKERRRHRKHGEHKNEEEQWVSFRDLSPEDQLVRAQRRLAMIAIKKQKLKETNFPPDELQKRRKRIKAFELKWNFRLMMAEKRLHTTNSRDITTTKEQPSIGLSDSTSSLPELSDTEDSSESCIVCMETKRDATFVHGDTGHVACCFACAQKIKESDHSLCPMCNSPIDSVIKHYYA